MYPFQVRKELPAIMLSNESSIEVHAERKRLAETTTEDHCFQIKTGNFKLPWRVVI
jgi:hypothetical protein